MSGKTFLGRNIQDFTRDEDIEPITHVVVYYGYNDDGSVRYKEATASLDNGRTYETTIACISDGNVIQTIANSLLANFSATTYKPFTANGCELDPAAELNDAVTVNGIYAPLGAIDTEFSKAMYANTSLQSIEDEDEFEYATSLERQVGRQEIELQGKVTFTDLSTSGQTVINGDNITTGTIQASRVTFDNRYSTLADVNIAKNDAISTAQSDATNKANAVQNSLDDYKNDIAGYLYMNSATGEIELGKRDTNSKIHLDGNGIELYDKDGNPAATIQASVMGIPRANVTQLGMGSNWIIENYSDGHLVIKWGTNGN